MNPAATPDALNDLDSCFTESQTIQESSDEIIARELSSLSVQEREEVFSDVHGVSGEIEETPDLLQTCLERVKFEMVNLQNRDALNLALQQDPTYVLDEKFLLRFLRADRFDPVKAAQRLGLHFEFKLELFGRDKLCRDICQDDLEKKDIELLYSGVSQMLPLRDRAGSTVWVWLHSAEAQNMDDTAKLRRLFYCSMAFYEDIETQRKGTVSIFWSVGKGCSTGKDDFTRKVAKLNDSLPRFVRANHFCYDSPAWIPMLTIYQLSFTLFSRLRFKAHYGSEEKCLEQLKSFGIPTCVFPVNENGKWSKDNFIEILEKRRAQERLSGSLVPRVGVPSRNDVLFGRGTVVQYHVGNIRYLSYVNDHKAAYAKSSKLKKTEIAKDIVEFVKNKGGRFLKDGGTGWVEVDDEVARDKVSHALRRA